MVRRSTPDSRALAAGAIDLKSFGDMPVFARRSGKVTLCASLSSFFPGNNRII
jgi:hypothetical protein